MRQMFRRTVVPILLVLAWDGPFGGSLLWAQGNGKNYEELTRSAQRFEMLGYVLGGVGVLLVVSAIPLGIYWDRKKKARRLSERRETGGMPNVGDPMRPGSSNKK